MTHQWYPQEEKRYFDKLIVECLYILFFSDAIQSIHTCAQLGPLSLRPRDQMETRVFTSFKHTSEKNSKS